MKLFKMLVMILIVSMSLGCASIMRGSEQQVYINSYDAKSGDTVSSNCIVSNDAGSFRTRSNRSVSVGRDKDYLTIDCQTEELSGRMVIDGNVNIGYILADFIGIDMCLISCWVDGLSGSWAQYPTMIDVPLDLKN